MTALDSLDDAQRANAAAIVATVQAQGLPLSAAQIAVTTAITESGLHNQANSTVPASLNYPHQKVGNDHDSVGLFQQRASWGSLAARMNPSTATQLFLARLPANWSSLDPGVVAQKIQVSAYPDRYDKNYTQGAAIATQLWGTNAGTADAGLNTGVKVDPKAPYPMHTLKPPLTVEQRKTILDYLIGKGHTLDQINKFVEDKDPTAMDQKLINIYEAVAQGGGFVSDPKTIEVNLLAKFFDTITSLNTWKRAGLMLLGGVILIFAVVMLFRKTMGGEPSSLTPSPTLPLAS